MSHRDGRGHPMSIFLDVEITLGNISVPGLPLTSHQGKIISNAITYGNTLTFHIKVKFQIE